MIKQLKRRFIIFNLMVTTIVFAIVGGVIFFNNESITWHRMLGSCIVFIILAFISSIVLAKVAIEPIKEAWNKQLDFTADASHELRTPLAVIQTSLEIVLDNEGESVKSQKKWLENILLEQQRMTRLVEDLLTLSRGDSCEQVLDIEVFELNEIIEQVRRAFSPIAVDRNIVIEDKLPTSIILEADKKRIKQLLVILVDNAIKYMNRAGEISLEGEIKENRLRKEEILYLVVSDNGQGIDRDKLKRIFERFYRVDSDRSKEGTGLGLAIAKWIVESHQGSIKAYSEVDKGTKFVIEIPIKGR